MRACVVEINPTPNANRRVPFRTSSSHVQRETFMKMKLFYRFVPNLAARGPVPKCASKCATRLKTQTPSLYHPCYNVTPLGEAAHPQLSTTKGTAMRVLGDRPTLSLAALDNTLGSDSVGSRQVRGGAIPHLSNHARRRARTVVASSCPRTR